MKLIDMMNSKVEELRAQVEATEAQLRSLKLQLEQAEQEAKASRQITHPNQESLSVTGEDAAWTVEPVANNLQIQESLATARKGAKSWPLIDAEYKRYGRQLIIPEVGLQGQLRLKNAKVLVVGVGGLGCPAAAYLAGAGIGTLGLVDGDTVELSNLHRQVAHASSRVGMSKVDSAFEYLNSLNSTVSYTLYRSYLTPETAIPMFEQYDLILDCTDHPTSRYLISDACVLAGKPLVSASALKTEGQLIVLNNPPKPAEDASGGPCYRCVFSKPPPAESVLSCGEGGILGPVVGVMGVLQALEAIKVLTAKPESPIQGIAETNGDSSASQPVRPTMLMFSAYSNAQFRTVRLRSRRKDCAACSAQATITKQSLLSGSLDYVAFCGVTAPVHILPPNLRISARDFAKLHKAGSHPLIDVRDETQYAICALNGSVNVPWTGNADSWLEKALQSGLSVDEGMHQYVVCRYGNDSQLAAKAMMDRARTPVEVKDIRGGFQSWREEVDSEWPDY